MLWESANGIGDDVVRPVRTQSQKELVILRLLQKMLPLRKKLEKFFFNLAESVGRRLRNAKMKQVC